MTHIIANISGRIGFMSELKQTPAGKSYLELAIPEKIKDNTLWHRFTAWNRVAENADQYLQKGDAVSINFTINYRKAGERVFTNFNATHITYLSLNGKS